MYITTKKNKLDEVEKNYYYWLQIHIDQEIDSVGHIDEPSLNHIKENTIEYLYDVFQRSLPLHTTKDDQELIDKIGAKLADLYNNTDMTMISIPC